MAEGIRRRHSTHCPARTREHARCRCRAGWEASVYSPRDGKKIRKSHRTQAEARAWRSEALTAVRAGMLRTPQPTTIRQAAETLLDGIQNGQVRNRSGDLYKPSVHRSYQASLRNRILPELGALKLTDLQRRDVQRFADGLLAQGLDASTVRNHLMPLRVIYRRALEDGDVAVNPCTGIRLPAVRGRRDRIASPQHAAQLLEALPDPADKAAWALALYAGLRRGEIMALRWADIDTAAGTIQIERSWDTKTRAFVKPKSRAGHRRVPLAAALHSSNLSPAASPSRL